MKKPKRRYHSIKEITDEIDRVNKRAQDFMKSAAELESWAETQTQQARRPSTGDQDRRYLIHVAAENKKKAEKLRISATRILDNKLPHLKEKMSEFQTMTFSFMQDETIEA